MQSKEVPPVSTAAHHPWPLARGGKRRSRDFRGQRQMAQRVLGPQAEPRIGAQVLARGTQGGVGARGRNSSTRAWNSSSAVTHAEHARCVTAGEVHPFAYYLAATALT